MKTTKKLMVIALYALAPDITKAGSHWNGSEVTIERKNSSLTKIFGSMAAIRNSGDKKSHITIANGVYYSSIFATDKQGATKSCTTIESEKLELLRSTANDIRISVVTNDEGKCLEISIHNNSSLAPKS